MPDAFRRTMAAGLNRQATPTTITAPSMVRVVSVVVSFAPVLYRLQRVATKVASVTDGATGRTDVYQTTC